MRTLVYGANDCRNFRSLPFAASILHWTVATGDNGVLSSKIMVSPPASKTKRAQVTVACERCRRQKVKVSS